MSITRMFSKNLDNNDFSLMQSITIFIVIKFRSFFLRGELEVDRVKCVDGKDTQPLCMAQHYQMFRLYRRPGVEQDEHVHLDRSNSGDHIIAIHHNQVHFLINQPPKMLLIFISKEVAFI